MVAYSDVPAMNALYQEQEQISHAIMMIDDGGKVSNFTVSPKPSDPAMMGGPVYMAVMIAVPDPPVELMAQARAALVVRQNAIIAELTALGVTDGPVQREKSQRAG
jgi:hypothetical protein